MTEKWIQLTGDDYAQALSDQLPTGPVWSRDPSSALQLTVSGLAQVWGDPVESLAALLLTRESDPRSTINLLPEWERAWGLPDECLIGIPTTIPDRQNALVNKMTLLGAQSRAFFIAQAATIGFTINAIREWSPFMCGVSRCGDTTNLDPLGYYRWEVGPPEMRFYWSVKVTALRFTWFRVSSGQCGVDPLLRIYGPDDLECLLRRWKPAHTEVLFDYTQLSDVERAATDIVTLVM